MLQWTTKAAATPCLSLIIHHTDGDRGYAHDRKSRFGKLGKGARCGSAEQLDRGQQKDDWKRAFKFA